MRKKIQEIVKIPEGVFCEIEGGIFKCSKGGVHLLREMHIPAVKINVVDNNVVFNCDKANKKTIKVIKSNIAHIKNLFQGLEKKYEYKLQACNVHFPMTFKVEGDKFVINNFLGEKVPRIAKILPGTEVSIKGQEIIVSSNNKELAGQTASNIEKTTKIKKRDRRVFQDGIYIVERPGRKL